MTCRNLSSLAVFFALSTLAFMSSAQAQWQHHWPRPDYNFVNEKPPMYPECKQYENLPGKVMGACVLGVSESERMADRYAGGRGHIEGFLRGYSYALYNYTNMFRNDATEQANGAGAVDSIGNTMEAGLAAGRAKGESDGNSMGNSDAIDRFRAVLDKNQDPDPSVRVPATNYVGEDNAYQKYSGQPILDEVGEMRALRPDDLKCYDQWDSTNYGELKRYSPYDLWFGDGMYRFEAGEWFKGDLAIKVWLNHPNLVRPEYNQYAQEQVLDPAGKPIIDPQTQQPYNLQLVFQRSFMGAYSYYVDYYFSREYQRAGDEGETTGRLVGEQLGKRLAFQAGLINAYNAKFKASSASTYRDAFTDAYTGTFQSVFADYRNNPQLSFTFEDIEEVNPKGVWGPGDWFSARFKVVNLGGVGSPITATMEGRVSDVTPQSFNIGRLQSQEYLAKAIGRIDPTAGPHDEVTVSLRINNLPDVIPLQEQLQNLIETSNAGFRVSALDGNGAVQVTLTNIGTIQTPALVSAELYLNGAKVAVSNIGKIEPHGTRVVSMQFNGLDPLDVINGQIDAKVVAKMGEGVMDDRTALKIVSSDSNQDLVNYFNQLANCRGLTGSDNLQDRLGKVTQLIVSKNDEQAAWYRGNGGNDYKNNPTATFPGELKVALQSTQQPQTAVQAYDRLGRLMWPARTHLKKYFFFFKGAKRKAYENLVKALVHGKL